jgi:hypothetical protein
MKERPPRHASPVRMRRNLAAQRMRWIRRGKSRGPLFLMELAEMGANRVRSPRGRPTASEWDTRRLVPFRSSHWVVLARLGARVGLSAGQLAALLIEQGVDRLLTEPQMASLPPSEQG